MPPASGKLLDIAFASEKETVVNGKGRSKIFGDRKKARHQRSYGVKKQSFQNVKFQKCGGGNNGTGGGVKGTRPARSADVSLREGNSSTLSGSGL